VREITKLPLINNPSLSRKIIIDFLEKVVEMFLKIAKEVLPVHSLQ